MTTNFHFDGEIYSHELDGVRLNTQIENIWNLMRDGQWRSVQEAALEVPGSETSIQARLRDMRKEKCGAHTVNRRFLGNGFYQYQLVPHHNGHGLAPLPPDVDDADQVYS